MDQLRFGLRDSVPAAATAAWGARFIVDQGGYVDLPWDRQDSVGDPAFVVVLNERFGLPALRERLSQLLRSGEMDTRDAREITLHVDDQLEVRANTNASAGYCYVAAWPKGDPA